MAEVGHGGHFKQGEEARPKEPRRSPAPGRARPAPPRVLSPCRTPPPSWDHPEWRASGVWGGQNEAKTEVGLWLLGLVSDRRNIYGCGTFN